jgi:hypothetical protein
MATICPTQRRYIVASALYIEAIQYLDAIRKNEIKALHSAFDVMKRNNSFDKHSGLALAEQQLQAQESHFGESEWDVADFIKEQRQHIFSDVDGIAEFPDLQQYTAAIDAYIASINDIHIAFQQDMPTIQTHHAAMVAAYDSLLPDLQQAMYDPPKIIKRLDKHTKAYVRGMSALVASYTTA